MANADERLILAVFNYDELYNSRSPDYSNTNRLTHGCARSCVCPVRFAKAFLKRLRL